MEKDIQTLQLSYPRASRNMISPPRTNWVIVFASVSMDPRGMLTFQILLQPPTFVDLDEQPYSINDKMCQQDEHALFNFKPLQVTLERFECLAANEMISNQFYWLRISCFIEVQNILSADFNKVFC